MCASVNPGLEAVPELVNVIAERLWDGVLLSHKQIRAYADSGPNADEQDYDVVGLHRSTLLGHPPDEASHGDQTYRHHYLRVAECQRPWCASASHSPDSSFLG